MHIGKLTTKYDHSIGVFTFYYSIYVGKKFFVIKVGVDQVGVRTRLGGNQRGIVHKDYALAGTEQFPALINGISMIALSRPLNSPKEPLIWDMMSEKGGGAENIG